MAFFDNFTTALKQKWLEYYQANSDWIGLHMKIAAVKTPDGGRRPPSYLILGILNALEPKLAQMMYPFSKLNPDSETLLEVLGLNIDPDKALGKPSRQESPAKAAPKTAAIAPEVEASEDLDEIGAEAADVFGEEALEDETDDLALDSFESAGLDEEISYDLEEDESDLGAFDETEELDADISNLDLDATSDEMLSDPWEESDGEASDEEFGDLTTDELGEDISLDETSEDDDFGDLMSEDFEESESIELDESALDALGDDDDLDSDDPEADLLKDWS